MREYNSRVSMWDWWGSETVDDYKRDSDLMTEKFLQYIYLIMSCIGKL